MIPAQASRVNTVLREAIEVSDNTVHQASSSLIDKRTLSMISDDKHVCAHCRHTVLIDEQLKAVMYRQQVEQLSRILLTSGFAC